MIAAAAGCNRGESLASRCGLVQSILAHRSRLGGGYRPALLEDQQCLAAVRWRGRPVVRARQNEAALFVRGETCDPFWPVDAVPPTSEPPEFAVFVELTPQEHGYRWEYWINSLKVASRGTCAPNEGIATKVDSQRGWKIDD
ncbi:MAG: hypothetical protein ABUS79_01935 [Pseudomonadota bacterium]